METTQRLRKWASANWERVLFIVVGLTFIGASFRLIYVEKITEAVGVFGLGFLSFIYANVARFKRFKGLGFEAELWEDKQKEAADLIERLRDVVTIYTREVTLGKVMFGRLPDRIDWEGTWKLYNDLISQHTALGQKIDFSDIKKVMDDYFLFDMSMPELSRMNQATIKAKSTALELISREFGSPIRDSEGYAKRLDQWRAIPQGIEDPFDVSTKSDLAGRALSEWDDAKERLKRDFNVEVEIDLQAIERLRRISKLYQRRPVNVTQELIAWANRDYK
jgi:hypothetical protein